MPLVRRYPLLSLLLLTLSVRLAALIVLQPMLDFTQAGADIHGSEAYDAYALNLLATGVYGREAGVPDAMIPPLYSCALAAVYGLFGRGYWQVGLFHTLLDLASVALLYGIARRLFHGERGRWIGLLGGAFTAGYPYLVFQNLTLIDTGFWMLLLHGFVYCMIRLRDGAGREVWGWALLAGLALGAGTLTRPVTPPLALLLALWFLFRLPLWPSVARLLPVALVSAAVVAVWIARNWFTLGAFIPMTTTSGANFWQGNSEWTIPVFQAGYDVQWTAPEGIDPTLDARAADAQRFARAFDYLRANSQDIPRLLWTKFIVHWNPQITPLRNPLPNERWRLEGGQLVVFQAEESITGVTSANVSYNASLLDTVGRPLHLLYFGGLLLLAILSLPLTAPLWRDVSLLWFVQLSMTIMYVAFHPSTRYRSPSDPLLFLMSAATLALLWERWRARRAK